MGTALSRKSVTVADAGAGAQILRHLGFISLEAGMLGFMMKLIVMLANLMDPAAILVQFSLGLVPVLYGIVFAGLFCFPLASRLKQMAE